MQLETNSKYLIMKKKHPNVTLDYCTKKERDIDLSIIKLSLTLATAFTQTINTLRNSNLVPILSTVFLSTATHCYARSCLRFMSYAWRGVGKSTRFCLINARLKSSHHDVNSTLTLQALIRVL